MKQTYFPEDATAEKKKTLLFKEVTLKYAK